MKTTFGIILGITLAFSVVAALLILRRARRQGGQASVRFKDRWEIECSEMPAEIARRMN